MGYVDELKAVPELAVIGEALTAYAKSLVPGTDFVKKGRRWVSEPHNFVTFRIQAARAKNISFTVYGLMHRFDRYPGLPLRATRSSYWQFTLHSACQLGPAAAYIGAAARSYAVKHRNEELAKEISKVVWPGELP